MKHISKFKCHCLKGQRALVSTRLRNSSPSFVRELLSKARVSPRLRLVAEAGSSPAARSLSCGSPVDTRGRGLAVPRKLQPQDSLTCGFAQLQPDVVKAFLRSGEQRAALGHGAMVKKKQAVRQRLGVLGEISLLICVLTGDSVGS